MYYLIFVLCIGCCLCDFKFELDQIKTKKDIDLVFLIDGSSSVGRDNFLAELRFVRKLLSDLTLNGNNTQIGVVTFGSKENVHLHVNSISNEDYLDKCLLLNDYLPKIGYSGGGTFTWGALKTAQFILENSGRNSSHQVVFLITDGYSNGQDPVPLSRELKNKGVTIFAIGVKTGRNSELEEIASHNLTYFLDGFKEFESLARRALHRDLQDGDYVPVDWGKCKNLCEPNTAGCFCGVGSGQYMCQCKRGYYGDGENCQWCPSGTWHRFEDGFCAPCSDPNHESFHALDPSDCKCKKGFRDDNLGGCLIITCGVLNPPLNGYFVGGTTCQNVINNACGVRCLVGYSLRGSSIRLCQDDASWSGVEAQCVLKTCPPPPIPQFGQIECLNNDLETSYNNSDMPVDTECKFTCQEGFALTGSPQRTCLPISQWDGLRTTCKPIKCHRLGRVFNGNWEPEICSRERQISGTKCRLLCKKGFVPSGEGITCRPSKKGPGKWDSPGLKCLDLEPPKLECPGDLTIQTESGSPFGVSQIKWPEVTDNSGLNTSIWTNDDLDKFPIGSNIITWFAVDQFGNEASCNTTIIVEDLEIPVIENCDDPPAFLTSNPDNVTIIWDEPLIYDNSLEEVEITRSHNFGIFPVGTTQVMYEAVDSSNNTNICTINITVIAEASCDTPPGDKSVCKTTPSGVSCAMTCQEGYGFALSDTAVCLHDFPGVWDVPECSPMEEPKLWTLFETEIDCTDPEIVKTLEEIVQDKGEILSQCSNTTRIKRQTQKIEFTSNLNQEEIRNKLGVDPIMKEQIKGCKKGSILRNKCVLCPKGTYYENNKCLMCPENTFNPKPGALKCEPCPGQRSTLGKKRVKSKRGCRALCPPGTNKNGLVCRRPPQKKPQCREDFCSNGGTCTTLRNRLKCVCLEGWTGTRCKIRSKMCLCQNGGSCTNKGGCLCPKGFVGDYCELEEVDLAPEMGVQTPQVIYKPCDVIPDLCENNGTCLNDPFGGYTCSCSKGYFGKRCTILPCDYLPCQETQICQNILEENAGKSSFKCLNITPPETTPQKETPLSAEYIAQFTRYGIYDYLTSSGPTTDLGELTLCTWIQTKDQKNYGTIFSYANEKSDNALTLTDYTGLVLYINGQHIITDIKLNDGKWNYFCLKWSKLNGQYNISVNGDDVASGVGLSTNMSILGGGVIVLGQEQDKIGGGFSPTEAFNGNLTGLQIWGRILTPLELEKLRDECIQSGDVVQWSKFRNSTRGGVHIIESRFCSSCLAPPGVDNGDVLVTPKGTEYSCHKGYNLFVEGKLISGVFTRKCLGSNEYEGVNPECRPVTCPYPGYIPHSRVQGSFYNPQYKTQLTYYCYPGFEPQTPQIISCQENGTWSQPLPLCRGGQCDPFPPPENSNITIISEHDYNQNYEENRLLEIGTTVEVSCRMGYELSGVSTLTCQENGTWDHLPPKCMAPKPLIINCKANEMPPIPPNSYTVDEIGVEFKLGEKVSFKCRNGYLPQGVNHTTCNLGGEWSILDMVCVAIECISEPPSYENMEYLNTTNKYYFGNMLKYECNEGYIFYGTNTIRCLSTGNWSKLKGKCARISCNKPNINPGETIIGTSYLYKDSVKIICPKNSSFYTLKCTARKEWEKIGNCS